MDADILQHIEDIKNTLLDQQKIDRQKEKTLHTKNKPEPTKRKAQLSVSSFVFITIIVLFAVGILAGDYFIQSIILHPPKDVPQETQNHIQSLLKLYINSRYAVKDYVGMIISGCLAWFFKGKIDEKDRQLLENKISTLEEQKCCSQCGKEI